MTPQSAPTPRSPLTVSCDRCRLNRADYRWVAASMAAHRVRPALALCGPCLGGFMAFLVKGRSKVRERGGS
jgi:hypothetical protein